MIILIVSAILIIVGVIISKKSEYASVWDFTGNIISIIFGIILVATLITLPLSYYDTKAEVERYYAFKETIENSRSGNMSEFERAALINEIANYNKKLASVKYWNDTIFDIFIYDGLAELEFLE